MSQQAEVVAPPAGDEFVHRPATDSGAGRWLADDRGGVSVIAGMAALTIGVLAAAGIVVGVMMDHARAVPGPNGSGGSGDLVILGGEE